MSLSRVEVTAGKEILSRGRGNISEGLQEW